MSSTRADRGYPVVWPARVYAWLCTSATLEGLARRGLLDLPARLGIGPPRSMGVRKGWTGQTRTHCGMRTGTFRRPRTWTSSAPQEIGRRSLMDGFSGLDGAWVCGHAEPVRPDGERDQAKSPASFPVVAGRTLLGADVVLPADFPADRTLAVVAFQRGQQSRVDRWIERAVAAGVPPTTRGATGSIPAAVVEVPVLSTQWRPVRRFIDGGMTAGIGDPDVLARTLTVYTDVGVFQRFLSIPDSKDVHALVVDRDGTILVRGSGDPDDESWAAIAASLLVG